MQQKKKRESRLAYKIHISIDLVVTGNSNSYLVTTKPW